MARSQVPALGGGRAVAAWFAVGLLWAAALALTVAAVSPAVQDSSSARTYPPLPSPPAPPVTSLWLGDSIVEGCCRERGSDPSMAAVAAGRLGWTADVRGLGGTGYTTRAIVNGVTRPTYAERVQSLVRDAYYDYVVIVGGNNDITPAYDALRFRTAVRRTFAEVRDELPRAQLVVVGPYSPTGTGAVEQRRILREEATAAGAALFVDPIAEEWMAGRSNLLHEDGFHPSSAGQRYLGERLAQALQAGLNGEQAAASARS